MNINRFTSLILGSVVIITAFFAVFGGDVFSRLRLDETISETEIVENTPADTQEEVPAPPIVVQSPVVQNTAPPVMNTDIMIDHMNDMMSPGYTLAQVATHDSATTCYSAINDNVYDLTAWINKHPGGKARILMICGKDGTALFNSYHGRSNKIAKILTDYYIGNLI